MKKVLFAIVCIGFLIGCSATKTDTVIKNKTAASKGDTIRIANDDLEYEIIIIEPGFDAWLTSSAKPRNFYSLQFLENKNLFFVNRWNNRVLQQQYSNLYEMRIDYQQHIHYGYEVNYLLYNYFVYFQQRYKQKL